MKKILIILGVVAIVLILIGMRIYSPIIKSGDSVTISMKKDTFDPNIIRIKKGTRVMFKNLDSQERWPASNLHPTHGIYPEFDPQRGIKPQDKWSFTFDKVGIWRYHDHLIPQLRGEIVVID